MRACATLAAVLTSFLMVTSAQGVPPVGGGGVTAVEPVVPPKVRPFALGDVKITGGPFKRAMDLDKQYILELDVDRMLAGFRDVAGLAKKADKYPSWESRGVAGSIAGHWLSAASMMYAATGDPTLKTKVGYAVDELAECQKANGDGYLAAFPDGRKIFAEIERGDIHPNSGSDLNGGWVPWYTTHKVLAGLRDAYLYCDNQKARQVLVAACDWVDRLSAKLSDDQMQTMLKVEQGGMNEVLADVYAITGDKKYLSLAARFNHKAVLDPLMEKRDALTGLHANTQVPKVIGLARQYELTGDKKYRVGAEFFWDDVVNKRSFANGGNSNWESFFPIGKMGQNTGIAASETCNTYNMLKLTEHLFEADPRAEYADYAERALYNHILASQDPATGGFTYYVSMKPGTAKTFGSKFDSLWCCTGTGMENHAKYGRQIYCHDDDTLYVNQFIPSDVAWKEKGLTIQLETAYPENGEVTLRFVAQNPVRATIKIRRPTWSEAFTFGHSHRPNEPHEVAEAIVPNLEAGYYVFERDWKTGDAINFNVSMPVRAEPMKDDPTKVALFYGPVLLAADLGPVASPAPIAGNDQLVYARGPAASVPAFVTDGRPVSDWVKPVDGKPMTFKTVGVGKPNDVTLVPFYQANGIKYAVYLDTYTTDAWAKKQAEVTAAAKAEAELTARTADVVRPGEQQPEQDHHFQSDQSDEGWHMERHWRAAKPAGFFSYEMKVAPGPTDVVCTYWGGDAGRHFDILIDGKTIATQKLDNAHPGEFFDVTYPIPADLTAGKQSVTVKFQGHNGVVGGVFGVRTVKR